jgi:hypothetical protein
MMKNARKWKITSKRFSSGRSPQKNERDMTPSILLYETSLLAEAEILRSFLEANGIDVSFLHDDCGGVSPGLTFSQGIRVFVEKKDEGRARVLLDEFLSGKREEE